MNNIMPMGHQGMVASPHYMASTVGSFVLREGGNAFDAAVAVSATLAVVYPHMTGIGGDSFFLMYSAKDRKVIGLNGSGRSGREVSSSLFKDKGLSRIPDRGVLSAITVPGMVDAWWEAWTRFGRLPWDKLIAPAIQYAEQGFPVSRDLYRWMCKDEQWIREDKTLKEVFMDGGRLKSEGSRLVQSELAATLRLLMKEGRDAFYKGPFMEAMVLAIRADGGLLTEEDFLSHRSNWVEPLSTTYKGDRIYQMPPNSQGFSLLLMMNILEHFDLAGIPRDSAAFYHLMVEVVKKAFQYRDRYLTDPDFAHIPVDQLLSKDFARQLSEQISLTPMEASPFLSSPMGQDTAYAAVVDDEGNAVSFIQSLYYDFGSAYVPEGTGVILQNRGSFFSLDAEHPNALLPNKRTFHTLMPGMVLRGEKPYLLLGTQGGEGQPQTQLSILTGVLDYGCTIQEAIALPRWVYGRTWGQASDSLKMENRNLQSAAEKLMQWGHRVELVSGWDGIVGQAQGICIDTNGVMYGAADPRGDGLAIGW
ncbi:gamma-glutamyltransferase [Paenibacillus validus]|uniref:Glutathione hydrolase proenzyme n=2 Tax=Paenibacillus validus TaxID=44253 RepID=A0A7X3CV88_9BACL|nr:gamma-glutamyltransferase [Paenibacillus validus]